MFLQDRGYINACKIHVSIVQYSHVQRKPGDSQKFHKPKVKVLYLSCFGGGGRRVGLSSSRLSSIFPSNYCKLGLRTHLPSSFDAALPGFDSFVYEDLDQKALTWTCSNWEKAKTGSKNTITTTVMTSIACICIYSYNWNWDISSTICCTFCGICHSDGDHRRSTNSDWTRHLKRLRSSPSQDFNHNWP